MHIYVNITVYIYHIPPTCYGVLYTISTEGYSYFPMKQISIDNTVKKTKRF